MSSTAALITTLKAELKAAGLTYADLALELQMAESSIKRMFAKGDMPLTRVDEIARVLKTDFAELARQRPGDALLPRARGRRLLLRRLRWRRRDADAGARPDRPRAGGIVQPAAGTHRAGLRAAASGRPEAAAGAQAALHHRRRHAL